MPACLQDSKLLCVLEHVSSCEVQETCESERTMHTLDMREAVYPARLGLKCVQMPPTKQDTELKH